MGKANSLEKALSRRTALGVIGGAIGAVVIVGCGGGSGETDASATSGDGTTTGGTTTGGTAGTTSCTETIARTQGPYWVDEKLNRSDVRTDTSGSAGTQSGALLTLELYVFEYASGACTPLSGVYVDIWHTNALGLYSDEQANNTLGQNFLRGYQISDSNGRVNFTTIYPGWYSGRTPHIHVRFRTFDSSGNTTYNNTTQMFFDPDTTAAVYAGNAPYNTRSRVQPDTTNSTDSIYDSSLLLTLGASGSSYAGSYTFGYPLSGQGN